MNRVEDFREKNAPNGHTSGPQENFPLAQVRKSMRFFFFQQSSALAYLSFFLCSRSSGSIANLRANVQRNEKLGPEIGKKGHLLES